MDETRLQEIEQQRGLWLGELWELIAALREAWQERDEWIAINESQADRAEKAEAEVEWLGDLYEHEQEKVSVLKSEVEWLKETVKNLEEYDVWQEKEIKRFQAVRGGGDSHKKIDSRPRWSPNPARVDQRTY